MRIKGVTIVVLLSTTLAGCNIQYHGAEQAVASLMKDPSSIQFRNVHYGINQDIVCGEVNAKNGYGAYAGFELFIYQNGKAEIIDVAGVDDASDEAERLIALAKQQADIAKQAGNADMLQDAKKMLSKASQASDVAKLKLAAVNLNRTMCGDSKR